MAGHTEDLVSRHTIARSLKRGRPEGLCFRALDKRQRLTGTHKAKRVQWANDHKKSNFANWMWVDSKVFVQHKASHRKRWQRRGKQQPCEVEKHPNKAHMYGALTSNGLSRLLPVSGTTGMRIEGCKGVGAKEYSRVIEDLLVPEGNRLFQGQPFVVVEDGAPAHRSQLASRTWKKHPHIAVKRATPCSPDIHPLENVWNIVDDKMMGMNFRSFNRFLNELQSQWAKIGPPLCKKLCDSVPRRLIKVLERGGSHIERNIYT